MFQSRFIIGAIISLLKILIGAKVKTKIFIEGTYGTFALESERFPKADISALQFSKINE